MITLFIGRFQPFHKGHLHDIKDALMFSDKVIIGIGSSEESNTKDNPFSFEERKEMIENVLKKNNLQELDIIAIPDIHDDERYVDHVISMTGSLDCIFTGNEWVRMLFEDKGYMVRLVDMVKNINATEIRKRIDKGENWEELVPVEVVKFLHKIEGVNRIKSINGKI